MESGDTAVEMAAARKLQVVCSEWEYDPELSSNTLVSYWNLVCSRRPLLALADAVYSAGAFAAMGVASYFARSVGRKPVIIMGVIVLLLAALGITFTDTNIMYITTRFLSSSCATTVFVAAQTFLFEVSTDSRRAVNIALAFAFGNIVAEFWFDVLHQLRLNWQPLQATILSRTLLMTSAFLVVDDSPRWLVYKRQMLEAEVLMLASARKNGFSLSEAVIMAGKIKDEVARRQLREIKDLDQADNNDIRRHAVVMSVTFFSATFAFYGTPQALVARQEAWVRASAYAAGAMCFIFLTWYIDRLPRVQLMTALFAMLAVLGAFMSVATSVRGLHVLLFIVTKGCSQATLITNIILILELFPPPVRCQAQCLTFACGRVAAFLASLLQVLSYASREDVVLAVMASLAFASMLLLRSIAGRRKFTIASEVSYKLGNHRMSSTTIHNLDAMKDTLETIVYCKKTRQEPSRNRSPSMRRSPGQRSPSKQASVPNLSSPSIFGAKRNAGSPSRPAMSPVRSPGSSSPITPGMRSPRD